MKPDLRTRTLRLLPGLVTALLLIAALAAPAWRARARSGPETDAVYVPTCSLMLEDGGSDATLSVAASNGVSQPLIATANVAACSLSLYIPVFYNFGRSDVIAWNPASLAPATNIVALRTRGFDPSALANSHIQMPLDPPLVMRNVPGIAEPLGQDLALEYTNTGTSSQTANYATSGDPSQPVALTISGATRTPIAGPHPVLSHRLCGGDASLQSLYCVQSVVTSNGTIGGTTLYEVIQRFRVPVATTLRWVEFATTPGPSDGFFNWGVIEILDGAGQSVPPTTLPGALVQNVFTPAGGTVWQSHYDFDYTITLQPEHDYWLLLRTSGDYTLETHARSASESPYFQQRIGPFFSRNAAGDAWTPVANTALNFRIIGAPLSAVGVEAPAPTHAPLRLTIAPSPARGPVAITWPGASGALRFEVLDARGRRVASGEAGASAGGRWIWNGADAAGNAAPAGVYFVRARDGAGRTAAERVVRVR